jgi:hypothetical protein
VLLGPWNLPQLGSRGLWCWGHGGADSSSGTYPEWLPEESGPDLILPRRTLLFVVSLDPGRTVWHLLAKPSSAPRFTALRATPTGDSSLDRIPGPVVQWKRSTAATSSDTPFYLLLPCLCLFFPELHHRAARRWPASTSISPLPGASSSRLNLLPPPRHAVALSDTRFPARARVPISSRLESPVFIFLVNVPALCAFISRRFRVRSMPTTLSCGVSCA